MRSGQSTPRGVVRPTAVMATSPHQKGGRGFKHMPLALPQYGLESPGGRFGAGVLDSPVLLPTFTAEPSPTTGTYPLGGSAFRGTTQGIQHLPTPKASEKKASALGRVSSARQAAANYASARSGAASYAAAHHPPHNPQTAARRRLQVLDDAQPSESSSDDDDEVRVVQGACPTRSQPDSHLLSRLACWRWGAAFWHSTARPRRPGFCANVAPYPPGLAPCPPIPVRRAPRDYLNRGIAWARGAARAWTPATHSTFGVLVLPYTVALDLCDRARPNHPSSLHPRIAALRGRPQRAVAPGGPGRCIPAGVVARAAADAAALVVVGPCGTSRHRWGNTGGAPPRYIIAQPLAQCYPPTLLRCSE
jgi:hypothetical protein